MPETRATSADSADGLGVGALTNGRRLARNVLLNGVGWLVPAVLGLGAVPVLVRRLGPDRFGILTLCWTLVGYFSLFDLGLGRALTHVVAERIGAGRRSELASVVWTGMWLLLPLGIAGGAVTAAVAPLLVSHALRIPAPLRAEATASFLWVAVAVPFVVLTAGLRGVLEAVQAFGRIAALRVPLALATFGGPVALAVVRPSLPACLAVLVVGRAAVCWLHARAVRDSVPELRRPVASVASEVRPLLAVGGWMTVSNIVSPLMVSLDRFVVGAVLSLAAVAHYAAAYEAVTRLWLIPTVLLSVLFPALSVTARAAPERAAALFDRGSRVTLLAVVPAALAVSAFAPEWLRVWVGPEFAAATAVLAQGLAAAVLVNVAGMLAFALVQAHGRADVTGRLHLLEVIPYAVGLWLALRTFGAVGVVAAWGVRVTVDTGALLVAAVRLAPATGPALRRVAAVAAAAAVAALVPVWIDGRGARVVMFVSALVVYGAYAWRALVLPSERAVFVSALKRRGAFAPEPALDG